MKFLVVVAAVVACAGARSINSGWVLPPGNIGTSGILRKDGSTDLFSHDFAHDIAEIGPSGIVLKSGQPIQLDADLRMVGRSKRSSGAGYVLSAGNIGHSGIVRKDGSVDLFDFDFAHDIAEVGPSGIVLKSGQPIQLDADLRMVGRSKRSSGAGYVLSAGNIGHSGIVRKDGSVDLFDFDFAHDIAEVGPSGIVLKSGQPIQLDENLKMVGRSKRHIMNDSGMLTSWGQAVVFREPFTTILLDGPAGMVLSDGQLIQKPAQ
ncbi:uncharacterized protein LOC134774220 [Penaeus indicus]|uniref:uncharacterized protein LOC134774220 n=1 Tax=Penaeus indicus TaxID=29960 RepID=UPI00300D4443